MKGKLLVVLGTCSGAGKSFITTAICRFFKKRGVKVAPFKAQNMSLNAVAVEDGEMAWAQFVQALACEEKPTVIFNPVLLKPVGNMKSEVIVLGRSEGFVKSSEFDSIRKKLKPVAFQVLEELLERYEVVVAEGAGSPVEINIKENDFTNIAIATHFKAPALLVADIDRGGVFAQIIGTMELLDHEEKQFVKGFVINRFRGDLKILEPGLKFVEKKTGKPVLAVLPYIENALPPEDSLDIRGKTGKPVIAVIRYPRVSNFSDIVPFSVEKVGIRWCTRPEELEDAAAVILPGSRRVLDDLRWMKEKGLDKSIKELAQKGVPVVGICGGYHMLGETLKDPVGTEGGGKERGLELLPIDVCYEGRKQVMPVKAKNTGASGWIAPAVLGYKIHTGKVKRKGASPLFYIEGQEEGCIKGSVLGTHVHNLFFNDETRWEFVRFIGGTPSKVIYEKVLEESFDRLAELIEEHEKFKNFLESLL